MIFVKNLKVPRFQKKKKQKEKENNSLYSTKASQGSP